MKTAIKKLVRNLGFEVKKFNPAVSEGSLIQSFLKQNKIDLVLDVGANRGQTGQFLREIGYAGRIVSFEPLSRAYSQLESSAKDDPLWEICPRTAIGNVEGEIEINVSSNSYGSSVLPVLDSLLQVAPGVQYINSEKVQITKLDTIAPNYIQNANSIFLKIDTQGYEMPILEGARQILPKVKAIQVEMSLIPLYEGHLLFREMLDAIDSLGYEFYNMFPALTDVTTGRLLQVDGIFIKKDN